MNNGDDLEGNVLSYDEEAVTNIIYDENNSFTKNKKSNLKVIQKKWLMMIFKYIVFEHLLEKKKPYMKEDVQFKWKIR